jgi:hypothetical protein
MPKGWENRVQNSQDSPSSTESESTIWSDEVTTGLFRKKVIETRYITNRRVSTNRGVVFLNQVDDIVVMNSKRMSQFFLESCMQNSKYEELALNPS